jgi:murein DD-endopeptidase MepM/ murein hydrolase activator NlpD
MKGVRTTAVIAATVLALGGLSHAAAWATPTGPDDDERPDLLEDIDESLRPYAEDLLDVHQVAVNAALDALYAAADALEIATEEAEQATAAAAAAESAAAQADRLLDATRRAEHRARAEADTLTRRIAEAVAELGFLARAAYQVGGSLAGWSATGDEDVTGLAAQRAELAAVHDRMAELRLAGRLLDARAVAATAAAEEAAAAAEAAHARLDEATTAHAAALDAVATTRAEEREQYEQFLAESAALEEWLAEFGLTDTIEGTGTFVRPGTGRITSVFGPRLHPILGYVRTHTGIDIGIGDGFVYAADHGVVVEAAYNDGYGYFVIVDHGLIDGRQVSTLYAHQPGLSVDVGMPVAKGQPIGSVGSTGLSTGPHLHFEVRIAGRPVDPWPWIATAPMPD